MQGKTHTNSSNPAQQQNININISYNLNTHKIPPSILAAKKTASKSKKIQPQPVPGIGNNFFDNIALNALNQGKKYLKKQNLSKKSNQVAFSSKQSKTSNDKKINTKKKKSKTTQMILDHQVPLTEFYNPLANNSKDFLKRNIQSPDIFKLENNRKLKTEGSCIQPGSTFKKTKKSFFNPKQPLINLLTKNPKMNNWVKESALNLKSTKIGTSLHHPTLKRSKTPKNKKSISQFKQKRVHTQQNQLQSNQNQSRHNKSCMLYSTKKQGLLMQPNLIETAEQIISAYANLNPAKARKRAQSAYAFSKNEKIVSKILNMSIISSQLGSSQMISSERMKSARNGFTRKKLCLKVDEFDQYNHYNNLNDPSQNQQRKQQEQIVPGNALRQYLNSIDLRIMKNIQDDTAKIHQDEEQKQMQRRSLKIKPNFDKSNRNEPNIQENNILKNDKQNDAEIVSFYNNLFSNILQNKRIQEQQKYLDSGVKQITSRRSSLEFQKSSKIRKQKYFIKGFADDESEIQNTDLHAQNSLNQVYEFIKDQNLRNKQKITEILEYKEETNDILKQSYENTKRQEQKSQKNSLKLNFKNYKQILNQQNNKQQKQKIQNEEKKQKNKNYEFNFDLKPCDDVFNFVDYKKSSKTKEKAINNQLNEDIQVSNRQDKFQQSKNLNIYRKQLIDLQQNAGLNQFKQEQIQRWNHVNRILSQKVGDKDVNESKQSQIMDELMKQSVWNKKWIEQETPLISDDQIDRKSQKQKIENDQKEILNKDKEVIIKSPKNSTKHKNSRSGSNLQPSYEQVCWQYNEEQLEKQVNKQIVKDKQNNTNKFSKNLCNSPNNFSEDNGSGGEQYDSKKYSQQLLFKDQVIEQASDKKSTNVQVSQLKKQHKNIKDLIDSLDEDEDQEISYQEKQINSNRWINPQEILTVQPSSNNEGRIRKFKNKDSIQQVKQKESENYLECELSNFGVKNPVNNIHETQELSQNTQQEQNKDDLLQLSDVLCMIDQEQQDIQNQFNKIINGKKQNKKMQSNTSPQNQNSQIISQTTKRKVTHVVEDIILELIKEFAKEISYILKKSSTHQKKLNQQIEDNTSPFRSFQQTNQFESQLSPFYRTDEPFEVLNPQNIKQQQARKNNFVGKCFGIDTSFVSVQRYLKQFKNFILQSQNLKQSVIKNINKDIGPNSLEILSYLRPQYDNDDQSMNDPESHQQKMMEDQNCEDQDGLFVVPSEAFSQFQNYLQQKIEQRNKQLQQQKQIVLTQKQRKNTNFWHRGIYQSWNQFLDFQRPYGINGKPYEWVQERKKFRQVQLKDTQQKLQKGIDKLLEAISLPSGIIYDKYDLPLMYSDLGEQQKIFLNQERLSRMLAIQLFESEDTWINYNDEMAQLLVQLSRIVEQRIFFQLSTELKKTGRRRNLLLGVKQDQNSESEQFYNNNRQEQRQMDCIQFPMGQSQM